jgi:tRNA modification GTPase
MLELHIHGGPATVKAVLHAIPSSPSSSPIRYAEPGEFTRRAFQNNRLDLAQVEALSDTLSAETEQQRRAAVRGNSGVLGKTYESWRLQLLEARGEMEALIDFSEDGDFASEAPVLLRHIEAGIQEIRRSIQVHRDASKRGELLRKGIRISLLGPPNAGKSSLLNRIVGREASIVSTEAGTTRDVVEVSLDIEGYLCTFADTAGLRTRPTSHEEKIGFVEQEGIRRAKAKAKESDLVIVLASIERDDGGQWYISYDADALEIATKSESHLLVINKLDTIPSYQFPALLQSFHASLPVGIQDKIPKDQILAISCKSTNTTNTIKPEAAALEIGTIKLLLATLVSAFKSLTTLPSDDLYGVTERQRQLLTNCDEYLSLYLGCTRLEQDSGSRHSNSSLDGIGLQDREGEFNIDVVLAAEHLRSAGECLGRLTGRGEGGDVEEVLGIVFEKFCVGK